MTGTNNGRGQHRYQCNEKIGVEPAPTKESQIKRCKPKPEGKQIELSQTATVLQYLGELYKENVERLYRRTIELLANANCTSLTRDSCIAERLNSWHIRRSTEFLAYALND